ncbi:unnamed protein product, partial [Rotaria sp. Silwood2]
MEITRNQRNQWKSPEINGNQRKHSKSRNQEI